MTSTEKEASYDLLRKYGARWAVLAAIEVDLMKKRVSISLEISKELETAHIIISSGCFTTCEADSILGQIEAHLIPICTAFGDDYVDAWFDLLGRAMQGHINSQEISNIPLLRPIESDCGFLGCVG